MSNARVVTLITKNNEINRQIAWELSRPYPDTRLVRDLKKVRLKNKDMIYALSA
jgi:hypothetical protein